MEKIDFDKPIPKAAALPPQSAAASALAGSPDKRPIESWAEAKGMFPQEVRAYGVFGARSQNPEYWKFAAAGALKRWTDGQLVTEAEFDAAVAEMLGASFR